MTDKSPVTATYPAPAARKPGEPVSRNDAMTKMYELLAAGQIKDLPSEPVTGSAAGATFYIHPIGPAVR